ncbi:hypothetical protein O181_003253 [Austropuccinia psidii MF-1]|uniref:MICOS complex subunit MIC12 n=1 Tax=Austropuccinia psidii MF-1 TaxID=1389203 RepID=A0A9Q3GDD6_9BASI|nr:hypothetical protein [Austropuccinia psidii MF-1]
MNSLVQVAKGAVIASGSYYFSYAYITNRTQLISTSLQDLTYQFNVLEQEPGSRLKTLPLPHQSRPMSDIIKSNWNQTIQRLHWSFATPNPKIHRHFKLLQVTPKLLADKRSFGRNSKETSSFAIAYIKQLLQLL